MVNNRKGNPLLADILKYFLEVIYLSMYVIVKCSGGKIVEKEAKVLAYLKTFFCDHPVKVQAVLFFMQDFNKLNCLWVISVFQCAFICIFIYFRMYLFFFWRGRRCTLYAIRSSHVSQHKTQYFSPIWWMSSIVSWKKGLLSF